MSKLEEELSPIQSEIYEDSPTARTFMLDPICFVLMNLPDRRFLLKRKPGDSQLFRIGREEWVLDVEDVMIAEESTLAFIMWNTTYPTTLGIMTDLEIEKIVGVYARMGNHQIGFPIEPLDFAQATHAVREYERLRVIRSFRITNSITRTSELQHLSRARVEADVRYARRHSLLH